MTWKSTKGERRSDKERLQRMPKERKRGGLLAIDNRHDASISHGQITVEQFCEISRVV
jgi:hypothetical protein